jgi:hypothetical protein
MRYKAGQHDVPAIPSKRAHDEARTIFKRIPYSALQMLAKLILDKSRRSMPTDNKAQCVAVIRGIRPAPKRKGEPIFLFGADQYGAR